MAKKPDDTNSIALEAISILLDEEIQRNGEFYDPSRTFATLEGDHLQITIKKSEYHSNKTGSQQLQQFDPRVIEAGKRIIASLGVPVDDVTTVTHLNDFGDPTLSRGTLMFLHEGPNQRHSTSVVFSLPLRQVDETIANRIVREAEAAKQLERAIRDSIYAGGRRLYFTMESDEDVWDLRMRFVKKVQSAGMNINVDQVFQPLFNKFNEVFFNVAASGAEAAHLCSEAYKEMRAHNQQSKMISKDEEISRAKGMAEVPEQLRKILTALGCDIEPGENAIMRLYYQTCHQVCLAKPTSISRIHEIEHKINAVIDRLIPSPHKDQKYRVMLGAEECEKGRAPIQPDRTIIDRLLFRPVLQAQGPVSDETAMKLKVFIDSSPKDLEKTMCGTMEPHEYATVIGKLSKYDFARLAAIHKDGKGSARGGGDKRESGSGSA